MLFLPKALITAGDRESISNVSAIQSKSSIPHSFSHTFYVFDTHKNITEILPAFLKEKGTINIGKNEQGKTARALTGIQNIYITA